MARKAVDWEAVEREYRAGIRSLRDIGDEFGCSHAAVRKRAEKEGWARDLSARIQAAIDDKVSRAEVSKSVSVETKIAERDIVEANATCIAQKVLEQREDIRAARSVVRKLFVECEAQVDNAPELEELGELMRDPEASFDRLNDTYRKVTSLAGRVKVAKDLADALRVLIELERKVLRIKDDTSLEDLGRAIGEGAAMSAAEAYAALIAAG